MDMMYELKDKLCEEMNIASKEIVRKPGLNTGDLEYVHMLSDTIKNIDKIDWLEDEGYSQDGRDDDGYGQGMSYAQRRDGRNKNQGGRRRYSQDDGRSKMMDHIRMAIDSADERDRDKIKRFLRDLENA